MSWKPLRRFRDPQVPKLNNLRRAAAAGIRVPETSWIHAAEAPDVRGPPAELAGRPLIVRSGSPTEDTRETSTVQRITVRACGPCDG